MFQNPCRLPFCIEVPPATVTFPKFTFFAARKDLSDQYHETHELKETGRLKTGKSLPSPRTPVRHCRPIQNTNISNWRAAQRKTRRRFVIRSASRDYFPAVLISSVSSVPLWFEDFGSGRRPGWDFPVSSLLYGLCVSVIRSVNLPMTSAI